MKSGNKAIVRKIARKSLAANRGGNAFIVFAVFLTTFMLGTIISISISYMGSLETYRIRFEGTTAHVGFANMSDELVQMIKDLDYVSSCATGYTVGDIVNTDNLYSTSLILAWFDPINWEVFRKPALSNITGEYPQNYDEIMVPSWVLNDMGITEPRIGMDIPVTYQIDMNPSITRTFKLSGYFTSYVRLRAGGNEGMFVSREFAEQSGHTVKEHGNIQIRYINDKNVPEYNERLMRDLSIDIEDIYTIAKYSVLTEKSTDSIYIIFAVFALILVIVGYLLVYNVLSVSVSRNIRFYGLLKTIGTTSRQIRKSIYIQILYICRAGVPLGLLFSILISVVFIPGFLTVMSGDIAQTGAVISFNPVIYISAAVFAVITAVTGALIPARKAARISPVEAVRYSEQNSTNRKALRSCAYNTLKVAWRNVFRVRKRALLVFISLFLGMTIFMAVTIVLESTSIDKMVESSMKNTEGDIYLGIRRGGNLFRNGFLSLQQVFTPEFMKHIESLPGLTEMKIHYVHPMNLDSGFYDTHGNIHYDSAYIDGTSENDLEKLINELQYPVDIAAFEKGEFVIVRATMDQMLSEIETIEIFLEGFEQPISFKVGGILPAVITDLGIFGMPVVYMSSNFLRELVGEPVIHHISLYIEEPAQRRAYDIVKSLTSRQPDIERISAFEVREEFEKIKMTMLVLGGGMSVILWLIGILNFINIITTSILSRRHEIALLESIGQSRKQSRKLLTSEGAVYVFITLFLVCIFGGALTYGLYSLLAVQFDYVIFKFPYIPMLVMVCVALSICLGIPRLTYRFVSKMTLVERLREVE